MSDRRSLDKMRTLLTGVKVPALATFALLAGLSAGLAQTSNPTDFFNEHVQPILTRCAECHSGPTPTGSLNLTTRASALKGGESGAALVPGHATQSLIYQMVSSEKMPPGDRLPVTHEVAGSNPVVPAI